MTVLTITLAEVKRQCAIAAGDTSQDAAITALVAAEQLPHEYALDPGILGLAVAAGAGDANALGLLATLTLGVGEILAGDYLQTVARGGTLTGFRVSSLAITVAPGQTPGQLGSGLTKQGLARLAPFTRAARSRTGAAAGVAPDDWAPVPQLIASTTGNAIAPPASVFDASFADLGDQPWGIQVSSYAGDPQGIPALWEMPEP